MGHTRDVGELSKSDPLSCLFSGQQDLDEWMSACVETYTMCRQRTYGDVHPQTCLDLNFQKVHDHIYADWEGCRWCRNRIGLKLQKRLQQRLGKGGIDQRGINKVVPVISLS